MGLYKAQYRGWITVSERDSHVRRCDQSVLRVKIDYHVVHGVVGNDGKGQRTPGSARYTVYSFAHKAVPVTRLIAFHASLLPRRTIEFSRIAILKIGRAHV